MKIKLRISIFGILMLLILIFGEDGVYSLVALAAAAVHEAGHLAAAAIMKIKFKSLTLTLLGARLGLALPLYSYRREWLLCAAGPAINILTGSLALYIYNIRGAPEDMKFVLFFAVASFFLAALNLLPIKNFDGGRMLLCVAAPLIGLDLAERLAEMLSFVFVLIIWAISLYLMLRVGSSLALFVFSSALFAELFFDPASFG